jgi:hypothetical protein
MRTYDKLIATIRTRQSAGSLRSPFGATRWGGLHRAAAGTASQVGG